LQQQKLRSAETSYKFLLKTIYPIKAAVRSFSLNVYGHGAFNQNKDLGPTGNFYQASFYLFTFVNYI
jgi:hypothetical protein